jgi:citrate synthase
LFQISLQNYFDLKAAMLKYTHCQPSELERMPFYEIEILLECLKELADKEEEQRKKQDKKDSAQMPNMSANSMMRQAQSSMPKMPNLKF